jgi:hypothetical protein
MNLNNPRIVHLQATLNAARDEFEMAAMFHETWKPTVHDEVLRKRMGVSYATHAFRYVQVALRRETLLALTRLWDPHSDGVNLASLIDILANRDIINTLAAGRRAPGDQPEIQRQLGRYADQALLLLRKYAAKGSHERVLKSLRTFRNERLAHRQRAPSKLPKPNHSDSEIEVLYQDTAKLIALLLSLVEAVSYDPSESAKVYSTYAKYLWASVRGETTEGHPNFRPPYPTARAPLAAL